MRLFTGIPLPEEVKENITEITKGRLPVAHIDTINLHITLNFLGELDTDQAAKAVKIFSSVAAGKKSFQIAFDKLIVFHRQIHITLKVNSSLLALQKELEASFKQEGFKFQNREYYPHVKLSNLHMDKVMFKDRKIENFPNEELDRLSFTADRIVLYESKLLMHHPDHTPLIEVKLT